MHRSEEEEYELCAACGTELRSVERAYAFGDLVLCYTCAIERGGEYDEPHDRWTEPPDVTNLPPTAHEA